MRTDIENQLINIVRSVVIEQNNASIACDILETELASGEECSACNCFERDGYNNVEGLMALAKKHQIQHLVSYYFLTLGDKRFIKRFFSSVSFTVEQVRAAEELTEALSAAQIKHVPLKGTVLRKLYAEAWMRNSCDIDMLVSRHELDAAGRVLEKLGYIKQDGLSAHDVTYARGRIHVELHYLLLEEYRMPKASEVLGEVWSHCEFNGGYCGIMSDAFYYFYHIAHMAKHFELGGCGMRAVLDTWILNHRCEFDPGARLEILKRGGLDKFEAGVRALSEFWFSDEGNNAPEILERFILTGGAYGNVQNGVMLSKKTKGGRLGYLLHRLFAPYSQLKRYYPFLDGKPYLLPFYEVRRWFDAFRRDRKKYLFEFSENIKNDGNSEQISKMLTDLGFNEKG